MAAAAIKEWENPGMCLGSRRVLCDFSNTLGLAKVKTHSVKFFPPSFIFMPGCIRENVTHLILIHFRLTQQQVASEELKTVQAAFAAFLMEAFLESLSCRAQTA